MNRVGKIFVVSILVMSVMFMAVSMVAFYTHRNWKAVIFRPQSDVKPGEPLGLKEQLKLANENLAKRKTEYENLQKAVQLEDQDFRARMAKLERGRGELNGLYSELVREFTTLKEAERKAIEGTQVAQEQLDMKLKEIDQLNAETAQAQNDRDTTFAESVSLTDKLHEKEGELARSNASTQMLKRQIPK